MPAALAALLALFDLERIEENIFRGENRNVGSRRVFGGQVLAQALTAAARTVEPERIAHSLHVYFILPGDLASSTSRPRSTSRSRAPSTRRTRPPASPARTRSPRSWTSSTPSRTSSRRSCGPC